MGVTDKCVEQTELGFCKTHTLPPYKSISYIPYVKEQLSTQKLRPA